MTMLSEEQARKATCPLIRYVVNEREVLQERVPAIYVNQTCQASECKMAWRWGPAGPQGGMGYCGAFGLPLCIVTPASTSEAA